MRTLRLPLLLMLSSCVEPPRPAAVPGEETAAESAVQEVSAWRACESAPPGALVPLPREVDADVDAVTAAIRVVLEGVNDMERKRGCRSFFSSRTAGALRGVHGSANGDTVSVDFEDFSDVIVAAPEARSFLPPGIMAELTWTIFVQFPDIDAVRFSFDGNEQAFWTWVGGEGTPAQTFTRRMWEQI